jgi:2-polyprenyl-3-methyl-5-hydroxy-6-metoxy-1,4-benzoquinol methylase
MAQKDEKALIEESKREADFFDKDYIETDKQHSLEGYRVPERIIQQVVNPTSPHLQPREYAVSLLGGLENKKILDYGAGDGWNAVCLAKAKARVWAIDISEKGIELTKKKAAANGVSEFVIAEVRNCYSTNFPPNMFDIVYGGGVLHHLDIEAVGKELSKILHPDGVVVFLEPIRETKIMDIIKKVVLFITKRKASEVTEDEAPLTSGRINLLKPYFRIINYRYFNVLSSANLLIKSGLLKSFLLWADSLLIRFIPGFRLLGRGVVIELRQPIKNS